jgi:hypothetical protein
MIKVQSETRAYQLRVRAVVNDADLGILWIEAAEYRLKISVLQRIYTITNTERNAAIAGHMISISEAAT